MSDRIYIHIEVQRASYEKLSGDRVGESSEAIRTRVQVARNIQQARFTNQTPAHRIAHLAEAMHLRTGEIDDWGIQVN